MNMSFWVFFQSTSITNKGVHSHFKVFGYTVIALFQGKRGGGTESEIYSKQRFPSFTHAEPCGCMVHVKVSVPVTLYEWWSA